MLIENDLADIVQEARRIRHGLIRCAGMSRDLFRGDRGPDRVLEKTSLAKRIPLFHAGKRIFQRDRNDHLKKAPFAEHYQSAVNGVDFVLQAEE
jgi:hypothetical protein